MSVSLQLHASPRAAAPALDTVCFSQPTKLDLCAYRGDSGRFRVTITDDAGVPIDVSAAVWDADVRATYDDPLTIMSLLVEPVAGTPSAVDVILSAGDSADLPAEAVWDLQMTLGAEVTTILAGKLTTTLDVSRAV